MKRVLTSICGILLLAALATSTIGLKAQDELKASEMVAQHDFLKGTILLLSIVLLLALLASILAIIKEEDQHGRKNHHPLL